jgi:hypothetical protein
MRTGNNRGKNDQDDIAGLLERIAAESGCMYLSDLRGFIYRERFRLAVTQIPASDYPVEEWQDAAYYMVGSDDKFKTAEEAKQRILACL